MANITTVRIPTIIAGQDLTNNNNYRLQASGIVGTPVWSLVSGSIPPGLSLNSTNGQFEGSAICTPSSQFRFDATFKVTDNNGDSPIIGYKIQVAEQPDYSKALIVGWGDSRGACFGTTPHVDGIKPFLRRLTNDFLQVFWIGLDGQRTDTLNNEFPYFIQPLYNAAHPLCVFCFMGGDSNDRQADNTISGETIAQRKQTGINLAAALGFKTVVQTAGAANFLNQGSSETARLAANDMMRGVTQFHYPTNGSPLQNFVSDGLDDLGGDSDYNSLPVVTNTQNYTDQIHYTAKTNRKIAINTINAIKNFAGLPLIPVFDINPVYLFGEDFAPFDVIRCGGTGTVSWVWKLDGVQKSTIQNPLASAFGLINPGVHTLTLEKTTVADGTVIASKNFIVTLGDIGGASMSPVEAYIAENSYQDFTASGVGSSPIIRKRQAPVGGSISNISGASFRYTDGSPNSIAILEASTSGWETPSGGTINANEEWDCTGQTQDRVCNLKGQLNNPGDGVIYYAPPNTTSNITSTGSRLQITEASTGKLWRFDFETHKFYDNNNDGNGLVERASFSGLGLANLQTNETVEFRRVSITGGAQSYAVYIRGTYAFTFTATTSPGLAGGGSIYDEAHTLWQRPDFRGATVSNFATCFARVIPLVDVTPPNTMTLTGATVISPSQINVAFATPIDDFGVAGIKVQRSTSADFTQNLVEYDNQSPGSPFVNNSGVTTYIPKTFYYRAKAKDAAGLYSLNWSNVVSVLQTQLTPLPPLNYGFFGDEVELFCEAENLSLADNANVTSFLDQSINARHLTANSSYPTFQTNEINGKPVVRFSSSNPLKNTAQFTVRCGWILAKYDSATFPNTVDGYKGLLSDLVDKIILSGNRNTSEFFDAGIDLFEFRSNDRIYSEGDDGVLHAPAPMNAFKLIFFRFWRNLDVDGIQLGQELSNTNRKWSGDVALLILTSRDFSEVEIRQKSEAMAAAYNLTLADVIPFQGSKSDETAYQRAVNIYDPPEGNRIAEVLEDFKQSFDLTFSVRKGDEFKRFRSYYRNHYPEVACIYRDYNMIPPEDIEGYFDSEMKKSGWINNNNYSVRFKEK